MSKAKEIKDSVDLCDEDKVFVTKALNATIMFNIPECKVPLFKRGNRDMSIESWFFQMRNFFQTYSIPTQLWVPLCVTRIHSFHFKEIQSCVKYEYNIFRAECFCLFETPDLRQTYLFELAVLAHGREENYESYDERVSDLVTKAHEETPGSARDSINASYFIQGLYDSRVRDVVAANPTLSLAESMKRASAIASSSRKSDASGPPARKATKEQSKESDSYTAAYAPTDLPRQQTVNQASSY